MIEPCALGPIFLAQAGAGRPAEASQVPADLEQRLKGLWEAGRAAWPEVAVPAPAFVRHLAGLLWEGVTVESFLLEVRAGDVYLACGCALGLPAALLAFDRSLLGRVAAFVARLDRSPAFADEVRQLLRERLLVGSAGAAPRIAGYGGRGSLQGWVRATAYRTALNLRRRHDEQPAHRLDEEALAALPAGEDVELDYLRARYRKEFQTALADAYNRLPAEQRTVLRLHYACGMTGEKIAATLQVHRIKVVRWLGSARTAMQTETLRLLRERLRLTPSELESLIRMVRSGFLVSVTNLLKATADPEG